jgi:hypothetical protein
VSDGFLNLSNGTTLLAKIANLTKRTGFEAPPF